MHFMAPNLIDTVVTSAETTGYPASNLLNHFPQKLWKPGSGTGNVTLDIYASSNANYSNIRRFAIINAVGIPISYPTDSPPTWEIIKESDSSVQHSGSFFYMGASNGGSAYVTYDSDQIIISAGEFFRITISPYLLDDLSIGCLIGTNTYENFNYFPNQNPNSAQLTYRDLSITKELNNGALFIKEGFNVKVLNLSFICIKNSFTGESSFMTYFKDFANFTIPFALIYYDNSGYNNIVYGRFTSIPTETEWVPGHAKISFNFEEVI